MDFTTCLNVSGISLEIIGFILLLIAVKQMPKPSREKGQKVGSYSSDWDYLGNVMSTRHPRTNKVGILLVIIGLGFQLAALFV